MEKGLNNIKSSNKPFAIFDVAIYLLLAITVLALIFSINACNNSDSNGFNVFIDDQKVLTYIYGDETPSFFNDSNDYIVFDSDKSTITVFLDEKRSEFNVISFDNADKTVQMSNSTCSSSKDCVSMPKISTNGAIYCAPHKLKISPVINQKSDPVVG